MNLNNNIKLIIWDMDDTFWKGTISEESVIISESHIKLIKMLVDRGIMNSISSKNDFDVVKEKLTELGIWDLFVFPKINWNPKGNQIKQIIEECKLRPINVLFIDDNPHNLGEAKQILTDINIAEPDIIPELLDSEYLKGNDDKEHKRLKQFKVLEEKQIAKDTCSSNDEFLRQSNIKVNICFDCENQKERILDLINRSNQLNYTKIRLTENELENLLQDKSHKNCYISVKDNYGDYGIVGFISIINNKAEHFLFSCRTIGMGVEQYVYATLNYPDFVKVGDVISDVKKDYCPDWINCSSKISLKQNNQFDLKVLLRGGCDLSQMEPYLNFKNLKTEFNFRKFHRDHTVFAIDNYYNYPELEEIKEKVPFIWEYNFDTEIFSKNYNIIIMSVLMDYIQAVYEYKNNKEIKIAYGNYLKPLTKEYMADFSEKDLKWFFDNFNYIGIISTEEFRRNLDFIRKHIGNNTKLIIINGVEIPHDNIDEKDIYRTHIIMNKVIDDFVKESENTYLLDMRQIVHDKSQLTDNIRHYDRLIYYQMAQQISEIIKNTTGYKIKVSKYNKKWWKNFIQNVFSIKNKKEDGYKYKIIKIFGFSIKIK